MDERKVKTLTEGVPVSPDHEILTFSAPADMETETPVAQDSEVLTYSLPFTPVRSEAETASNEDNVGYKLPFRPVSAEGPTADNEVETVTKAIRATMRLDTPVAPDEDNVTRVIRPVLNIDTPVGPDELILVERPKVPYLDMPAPHNVPVAPDDEHHRKQFMFDGEWLPSEDPLQIGEKNYSVLQNYRYRKGAIGLEGVQGYSKINSTAMSTTPGTYYKVRSAIQLTSDFTIASYILAQAENVGETASAIAYTMATPPGTGNFESTLILSDDTGAGLGRFNKWPGGNVAYCNGANSYVYSGRERLAAAFITATAEISTSVTNASDKTEIMKNTLQTTGNTVVIGATTSAAQIEGMTRAAACVVTWTAHGLVTGCKVTFASITQAGWTALNSNIYEITYVGANSFSIAVDTSGYAGDYVPGTDPGTINSVGYGLIGTTRPLQGVKFYLKTVNTKASTIAFKEWQGTAWTALTETDGTDTGPTLGQTESVTWTMTGAAKPKYLEGQLLYWYQFSFDAGSAEIYHITVNTGFQTVKDLWDGVYLPPLKVVDLTSAGALYRDVTLIAVTEMPIAVSSTAIYPYYGIYLVWAAGGHGGAGNYLEFASDVKLTGIKIKIATTGLSSNQLLKNDAASVAQVYAYNGQAFTAASGMSDGTDLSGVTIDHDGVISWTPISNESKTTRWGENRYWYQLKFSNALSDAGITDNTFVVLDTIECIPAANDHSLDYDFPFMFGGRPMLCAKGKEGNRVDYGIKDTTEGFNGDESSFATAGPLYFGGNRQRLKCAVELYNRFNASIYNIGIFCKPNRTYILVGTSSEDYQVLPISTELGCPAPLTMDVATVGIDIASDAVRNVAVWLSDRGPVMCDGAVVIPIWHQIRRYFDKMDTTYCINYTYIERAIGWFDPEHLEYNLEFPKGSATSCDTWLVYDLAKRRWFEKVPTAYPQAIVTIIGTGGAKYTYGFLDTGYMVRLENSGVWDTGNAIVQTVTTADMLPSADMWETTFIRRIKMILEPSNSDTDNVVTVKHYKDGSTSESNLTSIDADNNERYTKNTQSCTSALGDDLSGWSHKFSFSASTTVSTNGIPLIAWGFTYQTLREDQ